MAQLGVEIAVILSVGFLIGYASALALHGRRRTSEDHALARTLARSRRAARSDADAARNEHRRISRQLSRERRVRRRLEERLVRLPSRQAPPRA